jgi:hypothetical protein
MFLRIMGGFSKFFIFHCLIFTMKCSICGAEACYMVALDSRLSRIAKHVVDKYAARCKQCEDKKEQN